MNDTFAKRLNEYLEHECSDYGLSFSWIWNEDCGYCEVKISKDTVEEAKILCFRYDQDRDDLKIELSEDAYYTTREFDETVKYFWMLVSPTLFSDK